MNSTVLKIFGTCLLLTSCSSKPSNPEVKTASASSQQAVLITQVDGIPWGIEFLNKDTLLISLKQGKLVTYNLKTKKITPVKGAPPSVEIGQGGLLDVMLHPDFKKNARIYFSYAKKVDSNYTTAIAYAELKADHLKGIKEIFAANNPNINAHHFGSRMAYDENDYLYFTVGDRGKRNLAQDLKADQGKVHRIHLDGRIPKDNPFINTPHAQKSIWSYGHRNLQGLVYDFKTKTLYEQEHGPKGGDEINIIQKGKNYGWPVVTYGREYSGFIISKETSKKGVENPLYYYVPSIAPSGLELYRGSRLKDLNGKLISGALALTHLNVLDISDTKDITETRYFKNLSERIRDVKQGPDEYLYFSTDSGKIYRVE